MSLGDPHNIAAAIRLACYWLLGTASVLQASRAWLNQARTVSAIHLISGTFLLAGGHYLITGDLNFATYVITPILVLWVVLVMTYYYQAR